MEKIKIALLGLGNVGRGVFKIFGTNSQQIFQRCGYEVEIAKILVRDIEKNRGFEVPSHILTSNPDEVFNDDSIKIVVELIGGEYPAKDYMIKAMKLKKHVVTANKLVIATHGEELYKIATEEKVMLYYEASVAGGIPIIHGINESLTANKITEVIGIINGTTNYILTKMTHEGLSFDEALKGAQEKGFAEADPISDVEAYDAMYKLNILTGLSFGVKPSLKSIYREGITKISEIDIQYAKEFGYVIKLLAIAKEENNKLELRVHPTMIPSTHPLANVNDSFNAIFLKGNAVGDLMFYGRGAGDLPTGSAVVGDIISIIKNNSSLPYTFDSFNSNKGIEVKPMEEVESEYYLRFKVQDEPGVLADIATIFAKEHVSILSVIQKVNRKNKVTIVLVTHTTLEGNINRALKTIKANENYKLENMIRIENIVSN